MRKEKVQKMIIYGILLTIPALLLMLREYRLMGGLCIQTSDAKVYISIADNFIRTGHFIQRARPYTGMVVPPGTPFMITLFRLIGLSNYGIMVIQIIMFGISNILLCETERRITGRGGWSPIIYTLACMRCYICLGIVMVEHYYLFLLCLTVWILYSEFEVQKKLIILNIIGLAMLLTRPVLAPVYFSVLLYTAFWCKKTKTYKIGAGMILLPILIILLNIMVNYRETGELILFENYSGYDLYMASRPDAPVTLKEAALYSAEEPEIYRIQEGFMTVTEKNSFYKELARQNTRNHFGTWVRNSILRGYELFLRKYYWATLYALCGGILLAYTERKQKSWRATCMLVLTLLLAAMTSFGIVEFRYTAVIWPVASIHAAFLTDMICRRVFCKSGGKNRFLSGG